MEKKLKILLTSFFCILLSTIGTDVLAQNKYYLVFLATSEGNVGHAFVSFGYEDMDQQMSVTDGSWGLYPKKDGDMKSVIGQVPGEIKDDFLNNAEVKLIKSVTKQQYEAALEVLKAWKNKDYELLKSDCVSFVIEVANTIGLNIPERSGLDNFPWRYVEKLKDQN